MRKENDLDPKVRAMIDMQYPKMGKNYTSTNYSYGSQFDFTIIKDFATIIVSFLALVVSLATLYFSFIRKSDTLIVGNNYANSRISIDEDSNIMITSTKNSAFTFVNSGNRPISVQDISLYIVQPQTKGDNLDECKGEAYSLKFATDPFTIKPGEIIVQKVKINPFNIGANISNKIKSTGENINKGIYDIGVCVAFNFITLDGKSHEVVKPNHTTRLAVDGAVDFPIYVHKPRDNILINRTVPLFYDDQYKLPTSQPKSVWGYIGK